MESERNPLNLMRFQCLLVLIKLGFQLVCPGGFLLSLLPSLLLLALQLLDLHLELDTILAQLLNFSVLAALELGPLLDLATQVCDSGFGFCELLLKLCMRGFETIKLQFCPFQVLCRAFRDVYDLGMFRMQSGQSFLDARQDDDYNTVVESGSDVLPPFPFP